MLKARILLLPVRVSFRTQPPIPQCPRTRTWNHRLSSTWVVSALRSQVCESLPKSCWESFLLKYHRRLIQESRLSSGRFLISCIFGLSLVTGSVSLWPQIGYCTNDFEFGDHLKGMLEDFHHDEDRRVLLSFIRKLLGSIFLLATVLVHWGHPLVIAAKVALILFTTKPSPLSVYLYVEELRQQSVWQLPFIYLCKSYSAEEVKVEDYMFLCLAEVNLKGQKLALIGILGNWWVLPLSFRQEASSMSRRSGFPSTPVPFFNCI